MKVMLIPLAMAAMFFRTGISVYYTESLSTPVLVISRRFPTECSNFLAAFSPAAAARGEAADFLIACFQCTQEVQVGAEILCSRYDFSHDFEARRELRAYQHDDWRVYSDLAARAATVIRRSPLEPEPSAGSRNCGGLRLP